MSKLKDVELYLVNDLATAVQMKEWLKQDRKVLGVDTETSGLYCYKEGEKLRTIQIGDTKTGWVIPWEQWGGVALECLNEWEGDIALHNASFDAHWLKEHAGYEMPWHRTHDTMIMAKIRDPEKPASLKGLSTLHIDPLADDGQKSLKEAFKKGGWDWKTIPVDVPSYWIYSALDPVLTALLYEHYEDVQEIYSNTYELEMAALRICYQAEAKGMRISDEYCRVKYDELMERATSLKQWAKDNWGISIASNPQLADFFENALGAEFKERTPAGAPSVAKKQLELFMKSDNEMIAQTAKFVTDVKNTEKMAGTYFKNFLEMNEKGILHPNINTLAARTGRMSVTSPALQTLPSGDSLVRGAFVPNSDEEVIIAVDYSQVELRLMAHFSQDKKLQDAFWEADATGQDFFTNMGKEIYGEPDFDKSDPRRKLIKGVIYGLLYGAGTQKMADTAGLPYETMAPVVDAIHKTYPGISQFMKDVEAVGNKREQSEGYGYIVTGTGRRLPCDEGKVYSLVNFTLQGNAAEIMKQALVRLDAAGYGKYIVMVIHDEVVMSVPKDLAEIAMQEVSEIMSVIDEYAVNLLADAEGPFELSWGEKYEKAE